MDFEKNKFGGDSDTSPVADQTQRVLNETKKLGNQLYEEGKHKVDAVQANIRQSSDDLIQKVHEKPLHSLLIAAGVGFLLAHLIHKK